MRPQIPEKLAKRVESVAEAEGFTNGAEFIRYIIRQEVEEREQTMDESLSGVGHGWLTNEDSEGVLLGEHATNNNPVRIDRFDSDTGYNGIYIGKLGTGKTTTSAWHIVEELNYRDDIQVIHFDPLGDSSLDPLGQKIAVDEYKPPNPFTIQKPHTTPSKIHNPILLKIKSASAFIHQFIEQHSKDELDLTTDVIEWAIEEAYTSCGITDSIGTHSHASPRAEGFIDKLRSMAEAPPSVLNMTGKEMAEEAQQILPLLAGSGDGISHAIDWETKNMSEIIDEHRYTRLDFSDCQYYHYHGEDLLFLWLMNIYEYAKSQDNQVMIVVDDAGTILQTYGKSLEQMMRASRFYDLSMNFITSDLDGILSTPEYIDQCSFIVCHRISESDIFPTLGFEPDLFEHLPNASEEADMRERNESKMLIRFNKQTAPVRLTLPQDFIRKFEDPNGEISSTILSNE